MTTPPKAQSVEPPLNKPDGYLPKARGTRKGRKEAKYHEDPNQG